MRSLPDNLRPAPREPFDGFARAALMILLAGDLAVWALIAAVLR